MLNYKSVFPTKFFSDLNPSEKELMIVRADRHKENDKILKYTINLLRDFDELDNICRNDILNN